ncbi:cortical protein KAR9-domain-containing protein, partial [Coniella lustricola]
SNNQIRKLSPGLAARLKALGLGASKKLTYVTNTNDRIGKLSEDQIRQIEESHQRHSAAENLIIERRGKPWKGIVRIPSKSSLKSTKDAITPEDIEIPTIRIVDSPPPAVHTPDLILEDFEASEAIDMDTNKFRLPDHNNGNGTKVTLETRQEHLARDLQLPPSPEEPPPQLEELELPPPPPAKDTPPLPSEPFSPRQDFFNPLGLQRAGSVYTISRASFANQLEQLTSLQLPDAESLAGKVAAIPTAQAAVRALLGAAEQIRSWIYKASEVISGLDSDDDVEWSAAGGREGLEEVENATSRFAGLIDVYVTAIEELQTRNDIANVSTDDLTRAVTQMEAIMDEWTNIRSTLRSVRGQVEIAMEWEELWNGVLGEIETELSELRRLVFEMEERRHKSAMATANGDMVDMGDLRTIMEETRSANARSRPVVNNRFSLTTGPTSPRSPSPNGLAISADDSSVLALFARMQPLRASLDFLPMRLSAFESRADVSFPTACEELDMRREALESSFKKLQKDADGLRRELGEDRWVLVFRGAARQAEKMTDSVDRSVTGLKEAVDAGMHLTNQPAFLKKIESYEAKKTHYGPAIDRVLLIIERGVKDRLTVNGEILRLHTEMQAKWQDIKNEMKETDIVLDELHTDKWGTNLRDSISSMLSNEVSSTAGSGLETPYSSPPSSVIMSGLGANVRTPGSKSTTPGTRARRSSSSVSGGLSHSGRRATAATAPAIKRKPVPQQSTYSGTSSSPSRGNTATPNSFRYAASIPRPASTLAHRPRWNGSTKTHDLDLGHTFKPPSLATPSPYAKYKSLTTPVRSHSSLAAPMHSTGSSRLPMRSNRAMSPSPIPDTPPRPVSKLNLPQLRSASSSTRRQSLMPAAAEELGMAPRPATSFAMSSRRTSMLPMPKFRKEVTTTAAEGGRASPMPTSFSSRLGLPRGISTPAAIVDRAARDRPRWRHG